MTGGVSRHADTRFRIHGRRRGHRLRKGRQDLLCTLLPRLRVTLPADEGRLVPAELFAAPVRDVWLEVGFGAGEHLAAQARAHPGVGLIGCEPFVNGIASLLSRIHQENIANIRIFDDDGRLLLDALPDAAVGRVFVLFSDPWPKKRHHKRRFVSPRTLDALARVMKDGAPLYFASDHMGHVRWALGHIIRHPAFHWPVQGPADWRRRPADWAPTRYEMKALERGETCVYLCFRRRPRSPGERA